MAPVRVGVLGAGIIGVSSAVNIIESLENVDVTIVSDKFSPHTTGDNSAGFWEPFISSGGKIRKWSKETFDHLARLSRSKLAGKLGAQFVSGYQLGKIDVDWHDIVLGFRPMTKEELALFPSSDVSCGAFFTTLTIECTLYIPFLLSRFKERGGKVVNRRVNSLEELAGDFDLIVNCCGLSAWSLVSDKSMRPVRGQVVKVHAPWMKHFVVFDEPSKGEITYVLPGMKAVTVGGTFQDGNWDDRVDEKDRRGIWQRSLSILPSLKEAKPLYDWAGLRPFRPETRLELEDMTLGGKTMPVIHNYGHGGSGVTVHWGCAREVTDIARDTVQRLSGKRPTASKL